jgi:hypothetical protein
MTWGYRVRLAGLELDAQTLSRDPEGNRRELSALHAEMQRLRKLISPELAYPVALEFHYFDSTVRVIAEDRFEADRIQSRWLLTHPGGGVVRQHARYCPWSAVILQQIARERKRAS